MPDVPDENLSDLVHESTQRLVRSVDAMTDDEWGGASLLPGWTRAHVVAHLTLNAEGLDAALTGLVQGKRVPMYASQEARHDDIEQLGGVDPSRLRTRFLASVTGFADAVSAVPQDEWSTTIERVPGGRTFSAHAIPGARLREIEVHHADLALAYTQANWPPGFAPRLVNAMAKRAAWAQPFQARATDTGHIWQLGEDGAGGPTVSGAANDLGWWLTGRGDEAKLTSDDGTVPGIEAW